MAMKRIVGDAKRQEATSAKEAKDGLKDLSGKAEKDMTDKDIRKIVVSLAKMHGLI